MKFAVIGSAHGHIYEFIEDMLKTGGEFIGVYNDNSQIALNIAEKYGVPVFKSMENIFNTGVKIVGTSAIPNKRIDIIERCNQYGVHVIADKPIVVNLEQYERLVRVIEKGKIEVGMMLTTRFMSEVYSVKKIIDEGLLGHLVSIEIFNPHRLTASKRPDWHFEKEQNGSIIIDLMVHSIDLFNWFTGSEIVNYNGVAQKTILKEKKSFYDSAQFIVCSKNGISGYLRVNWHMPDSHWTWGDLRIFCSGTKGCLEARVLGDPLTKKPVIVFYQEGNKTRRVPVKECNNSVTKDFIKRINGESYLISHKDILDTTRLCLSFDKQVMRINLFE